MFVFYTDSQDSAAKLRGQLRGATGASNLGVNCDPDPRWHHYRDMRGRWGQDPPTLKDVELVGLGWPRSRSTARSRGPTTAPGGWAGWP